MTAWLITLAIGCAAAVVWGILMSDEEGDDA